MTDPRPREQMTPEELAATLLDFAVADSVHTVEARHRLTEAAAHLRRLAAMERENRLLREEALRHIVAWEGECARLRRVLASLAESPWRASAARRIIREALADAPDAPDAQEAGNGA
jgi:hypothetical protein